MKLSFLRNCIKPVQILLLTAILVAVFLQASFSQVNAAGTNIDISSCWGQETTYNISNEGTIDLTAFPSTEAGKLTLNISGSAARVTIMGGGRTYTNLCIMVGGGANVTLNNVSINNENFANYSPIIVNDNNVDNLIMFSGENTLIGGLARPGITVLVGNNLTIDKSNPALLDTSCILNANGGYGGAGIGGMQNRNCGSITIKGGTVNATGNGNHDDKNNSGAGIGGGSRGNGGIVTISGGIVTAKGANGGAGIGGGGDVYHWSDPMSPGVGGDVTITGGIVHAIGSGTAYSIYEFEQQNGSAGIGGGAGYENGGVGGNVTIRGGTVTATGVIGGAGIGGGGKADGGNVTISGGIVYAISSDGGAGIGGGGPDSVLPAGKGGVVTITGGTVEAVKNGTGCDIGGGKGAEGSKNYFSGGSIKAGYINCAPVVSSIDNTPVDRNVITIPGISSVTEVSYTVDGGTTQNASTDSLGRMYLWLPRATDEKVYNLSVTVLADPSKTYSIKTDPIIYKWGKSETYTVTDSRTIDLANFSSTPDAGNLTIAASGSTADVKIVGDANVTYKNLHIYIDKGAHVTLYQVNIDNSSCSADYSPVEAGDSNAGNTMYLMQSNNLTGSKNMPGVFVAEGTNLNICRSSDPMTGTARLLANGGTDAAGIGGKNGGGAGSINFNNESIIATGNGGGSGIGGGNNGAGGTVSVVNAIVTAQKGSNATYDIGGGQGAAGGQSYITSGVVFASGISNTPEVSISDSTPLGKKSLKLGDTSTNISYVKIDNIYNCSNIKTDSNGYLNLYFTKGTHSVFYSDGSKLFVTSDSSSDYLTVTRLDSFLNTGYSADSSGNINISESGNYLITGNTTSFKSSIKVAPDINVNITLDNVKLNSDSSGLILDTNTTVNLTIKGTNTLSGGANSPGITVPYTSSLSIEGTDTDSLTIDGNGSAGIYNSGTVSIKGGKITANGGASGAGIGGSKNDAGGNISISGGTVAVTGGNGAAGIGGGANGAGGTVTITGGMIKAVKGTGAPYDIGSGNGTGLAGGTNTFTGGSINVGSVSSLPTDGTAPVYLTTVDVIDNSGQALLDTKVSFTMPNGVKFDTSTDSAGKLYPWLPTGNNATVTISSGGKNYNATGDVTIAGPNNMTTAPTVDSVAVTPASATVQKGNTQTFSAEVTGINSPAQTVTWAIQGNTSVNTAIDNSGKLTVAADETAATLTVRATSTVDNTKAGTVTVTVTEAPPPVPTVDSVTVTPATATVQKGNMQTFSAEVIGTNSPAQTVTWSVTGGIAGTSIDNTGKLTVAADETAVTLTVRATSTVDHTKSGTVTVTVTEAPPPVPTVESVTVTPASATVQKGNTQTFSAAVTGTNSPAQTVTWAIQGNTSVNTAIDNSGKLTVAADETAATLTVRATSTADNTKAGTVTVTVTEAPPPVPTVDSVTVTPATATVQKGNTQTFSAAVIGTNSPAQTVTWSVTGGIAGTSIDNTGKLTVAADETASTLTVRATSTVDNAKSGTATVTVTEAPTPPAAPTVESVTVTPATAAVQKGNTQTFSAAVIGTNSPAQTVTWAIQGNTSVNTAIDNSGKLTVAADETAATLTVRAVSTVDNTKSGTATVTVTEAPTPPAAPTVESVTVTPASATVQKGNTQTFSAAVTGTNSPAQTVIWAIQGNTSVNTAIDNSGKLTVAADETAATLTVRATSTVDNTKAGTVTVTVTEAPPPVPTVESVTVTPASATVQKGNTQTFSAAVTGTNSPAQTVIWAIQGNTSVNTAIDNSGKLTVAADETAATLTVRATSTADNTKSGTVTVTVIETPPPVPTVESVTVTPATATVQKGNAQTFSAEVIGTNSPAQTVTWSVTGGIAGTSIDNTGKLTVAADETASTLTVRAVSTVDNTKSGTATVTVTEAPTPPAAPTVDSVAVTPASATVQKGNTQNFSAAVTGTNSPAQTVTWAIQGNTSVNTSIDNTGKLTVAADETATTLTVRATSTVDNAKSGTATVTVTEAPTPPAAPTVESVTVTPATATVQKGNTQTFSAAVTGTNSPAQTVTWAIQGNISVNTSIDNTGKLTVAADETAATLTVRATSTVDNAKSGTATVTVTEAPTPPAAPTVESVTVTPATAAVQKGNTRTFSAAVTGTNSPAQTVTWAIQGNTSVNTGIDNTGKLTVAADETAATLTVRATSTADNTKSGTATVTVTESPHYYALSITTGTGGSITTGSSGNYAEGTVIDITATASANYSFNQWTSTGGGSFSSTISPSITFTMPAKDVTVTATWNYSSGSKGGGGGRDSGSSSSGGTTVTGSVIDSNGTQVSDVTATATNDSQGNYRVSMKAAQTVILKQPDGTKSSLSDLSKVTFATAAGSPVTVSADGTINLTNLAKGTKNHFNIMYDLGNGQTITIGTIDVKVSSSGAVSLTCTLIDPYGVIVDAVTGLPVAGANVTLYYANTDRNKSNGKTPDTVVPLPGIDGFKPNNNLNPQLSDASGAYGFMVFPVTDYYIVAAKEGYNNYTSPTIAVEQDIVKWDFKMNQNTSGVTRLAGPTSVDTALVIAKASYTGKVANVILAAADNYPDALAGSVLASKLNAPVLLVGSSDADQEKVLAYMKDTMNPGGTVYILGGPAVVSSALKGKVTASGFVNITRLGGIDRYETSVIIADQLKVQTGTPIVLAYGENYPDALSISSMAAEMQYPILLVKKGGLSDAVKNEIAAIKPTKVYIIGGQGVISRTVESQVAQITSLDKESIVRIAGVDRYETSIAIAQSFNLSGQSVCIATGDNFPDALAGSVYASNHNVPIILADGSLSDQAMNYLKGKKLTGAILFGGEAVVSKNIEQQLGQLIGKKKSLES